MEKGLAFDCRTWNPLLMQAEIELRLREHWAAKGSGGDQVGLSLWDSLKPTTQKLYARGVLRWLGFCKADGCDAYAGIDDVLIARFC